jgi:TP901 family phage tail tape measure protein
MAFSSGAGANLGSAEGRIVISTADAERNIRQLQGTVGTFARSTEGSFNRVATGFALLAGAGAVAGIFTGAATTAANFEQQMAGIAAVAGAVGDQFDALREKALQLGKDTQFSASQAALAMEELVKAGVSVDDVLNGAADGAVALAAAAGTSLPEAASVIANALNQFRLGGEEATHFADLFAAAANASAGSAQSIGHNLEFVGGQAHQLGLSAEDTVTALALLSASMGERSGTGLNSALSSLAGPTDIARAKLAEIGFTAFDAAGNFKQLPVLLNDLNASLEGLTPAARAGALQKIFDEQGMRAINGLLPALSENAEGVGKSWSEMSAEVNKSGAAAENAKIRMDTFNGALEQLRGSIEVAAIVIGTAMLPVLRELVEGITTVVNAFVSVPGPIQAVLAGLIGAAGVIAGVAGVIVLAGPKMAAFGEALTTIRTALLGFAVANPIIFSVVAALALFAIAYKTNFGGFADFVNGAVDAVQRFADAFSSAFIGNRTLDTYNNLGAVFIGLGSAISSVTGLSVVTEFTRIAKTASRLERNIQRMGGQFRRLSRIIKTEGLGAGFDALFGSVGQHLLAEFGDAVAALPRAFGTAIAQIRTGIEPLDRILINTGKGINLLGRAFEEVFAGNIDRAISRSRAALLRFDRALNVLATVAIAGLRAAISTITDVAVAIGSWVISEGPSLIDAVQEFIVGDLWPRVKETASDIGDAVVRIASWSVQVGAGILDAVAEVARRAWALVQRIPIELGFALLGIGGFLIVFGDDIWDAVSGAAVRAWDLVKSVAIQLGNAAVSVARFIVDITPGIYAAISEAVVTAWNVSSERAITIGEVIVEGTVRFVASDGFRSVAGDIGSGIVRAIIGLGSLAGDLASAVADKFFTIDWVKTLLTGSFGAGQNFGAAIRQFIIDAVKTIAAIDPADVARVFTLLAKAAAIQSLNVPAATAALIAAFLSFVAGAVKGLIFGDKDVDWSGAFDSLVTTFATAAISLPGRLRDAISGIFTGGTNVIFGDGFSGGRLVTTAGLFDNIWDDLKLPPFPTFDLPDFPDIAGAVQGWASDQVSRLTNSREFRIAAKILRGDLLGAANELFGDDRDAEQPSGIDQQPDFSIPGGLRPQFEPTDKDRQDFAAAGTPLGEALVGGVVSGIEGRAGDVGAALSGLFGSGGGRGAIAEAGGKVAGGFSLPAVDFAKFLESLREARTGTVTAMGAITTAVADIVTPLSTAAIVAATGFVNGLRDGFAASQQVTRDAMQGIRDALNTLGSLYSGGQRIGASLGDGIADGIWSRVNAVASAAAGLVDAALGAAQRRAEEGSPSRLFAREVGLPIAQGMAVGIADGTRTVQRSIGDLINAALPTTSATSLLGQQSIGRPVVGGGGTVVNVFALKSDDLTMLMSQAERGARADDWVSELPRSWQLTFGGANA